MRFCHGIVLLTLFLTANAWCQDAAKEKKMLEGTWIPTSAELGGSQFPDATLKTMKLVITGDKYTVTVGEVVDKGTVKIDAAKKPVAIDITGTEGPNKGKTFLAIYEFQGETLRICYDLSGKARPTEFKTQKETPLFLAVYQRAKEKS